MSLRSLTTYRKKRDFEKTSEPSGDVQVAPSTQRRFVIQKHDASRLHYDLRLEFDGVFKSWAVTKGPSLDPSDKRLAVEVEDHPLDYGDFEGTIPEGQYGGGTVLLWDRGYWESDDPARGFKKGDLKFTLHGEKLHGSWVLVRMRNDRDGGKRTNWLLIKHRDDTPGKARATQFWTKTRRSRPAEHGPDRRRQGQGAETVHDWQVGPHESRRGLAFKPGDATKHLGKRTAANQAQSASQRRRTREKRQTRHAGLRRAGTVQLVDRPPAAKAGATRSSSMATAYNCASRAARPR